MVSEGADHRAWFLLPWVEVGVNSGVHFPVVYSCWGAFLLRVARRSDVLGVVEAAYGIRAVVLRADLVVVRVGVVSAKVR